MKQNPLLVQIFCGLLLGITIVSCAGPKDSPIVRENTGTGTKQYQEADHSGEDLAKRLQVPERYVFSAQSEDGSCQLTCDADIILPDTAGIPTYKVGRKPIDQEWIDCVTNVFFGNTPVYDGNAYLPDPEIYGRNVNNPLEKKVVSPWLEIEEALEYPAFYFYGIVEMGDSLYSYHLNQLPEGMKINVLRKKPEALNEVLRWESGYYDSEETTSNSRPSREEAERIAGITLEEAEETAKEYLEKLNLDDFSPKYTCLSVCCYSPGELYGFAANQYIDAGYLVSCTRDIQGIPITIMDEWGINSIEPGLDGIGKWDYEKVEFFINQTGLQEARLNNMYSIGEQEVEDVELLSFPEVAGLFEQVAQAMSEMADAQRVQVTVNRVELGFMRVYNPGADINSGLLIPVWDFFGSREYEDERGIFKRAEANQSILTINASNGAVIDRSLGY